MNSEKSHIVLYLSALVCCVTSCVEPFEAETLTFQNILVIDARITNEFKKHQVILAKSYPFENENFEVESNAIVQIIDDAGTIFDFKETEAGKYISISMFGTQPNKSYQLLVTTADNNSYESEMINTPTSIPIKEVKADIIFNDSGKESLHITLINEAINTDTKYFRYEYEETYKIVAPYYNPLEFDVIDSIYFGGDGDFDTFEISVKPRIEEARVCYNTLKSTDIVLSNSQGNIDNQTTRTSIRFLESDDFKISHRYSILVKQFRLTQEAYSYYNTLDDFTSSESVFNEKQSGFLMGNIKAVNGNDAVLGYFEVAALNDNRYFFNYKDFFPDRARPPYVINCKLIGNPAFLSAAPHVGPGLIADSGVAISPLLDGIQAGVFAYFDTNQDYEALVSYQLETADLSGFPYYVKATPCIDCRVLGSNIKPDFWVD